MDPLEALTDSEPDNTGAADAARWLQNPTTPAQRKLSQAELWATEPEWQEGQDECTPTKY